MESTSNQEDRQWWSAFIDSTRRHFEERRVQEVKDRQARLESRRGCVRRARLPSRNGLGSMARAFLAVSMLDLPKFARARIAVIDPEVLDFLKLISPMARPLIPGNAAWLVGWRSESLRGLRNGESDHPVFIPQIAGKDMDFGWHDALARWAVTERSSTWLHRFTLQARAIIRAVCDKPARFLICEKCGRPASHWHHESVRFALIRDEFLDLRGLSKDSPDLENWFEEESHRTEWIGFHHSRSQLDPLCVLCHRKAHHE